MKIAWIATNLIGLAIILGGASYSWVHKSNFPFVMVGFGLMGVSNLIKVFAFKKR